MDSFLHIERHSDHWLILQTYPKDLRYVFTEVDLHPHLSIHEQIVLLISYFRG